MLAYWQIYWEREASCRLGMAQRGRGQRLGKGARASVRRRPACGVARLASVACGRPQQADFRRVRRWRETDERCVGPRTSAMRGAAEVVCQSSKRGVFYAAKAQLLPSVFS